MAEYIQFYDRNTYETEKVKGWDVVRMFKATALHPTESSTDFEIPSEGNVIQQFTQNYTSNYKGTNAIDITKYENLDSLRITANGLIYLSGGNFAINFRGHKSDYSEKFIINSNYGNGNTTTAKNAWVDWWLDLEVTFFYDYGQCKVVVNGKYFYPQNGHLDEIKVVPLNGYADVEADTQYIDLQIISDINTYIKSVNIDFVE